MLELNIMERCSQKSQNQVLFHVGFYKTSVIDFTFARLLLQNVIHFTIDVCGCLLRDN